MLKFAEEAMRNRWVLVKDDTSVKPYVEAIESRYQSGKRRFSDFKFDIGDDFVPMLRLGPYTLRFSRLAFSRFLKMYGVARGTAFHMGRNGNIGRNYLISLINDVMEGKSGGSTELSMTAMLYQTTDDNVLVVRELLRDKDDEPVRASQILECIEGMDDVRIDSILVSDYVTLFRLVKKGNDMSGDTIPLADVMLSLQSKMIHVRPVLRVAMPDGSRFNMVRPGDRERMPIQFSCDAIAEGVAKELDAATMWGAGFKPHVYDDTKHALATLIKSCKERRMLSADRKRVVTRAVNSWGGAIIDGSILAMACGSESYETWNVDLSSRLEVVAFDAATGACEPGHGDLEEASGYLATPAEAFLKEDE